jgi:hypothetical protein
VTYEVKGSSDLSSFTATVSGPLATPIVPASLPPTPPSGYDYVSFRLEESEGLSGKGFLRATAISTP